MPDNIEQFLDKPTTITLCGSTRFFAGYMAANRLLTFRGWTVLSCGQFGHSYHRALNTDVPIAKVKALHFHKILQSDAICLVNTNQYLGKSTELEIDFAVRNNKAIIEFEATSLHNGIFTAIDISIEPQLQTLDDFLLSDEWEDFSYYHPEYYMD